MIWTTVKRNRFILLFIVILSPLMYHFLQERDRLRSQTVETSTIDPDIIKKIQSLRDRLRDAEFQNSARSQELISLKAQLSELETAKAKNTRTSNKSHSNGSENSPSRIFFEGQNILRLPSIYNFMPHLMDSPGSLKPALHVSRDRQGVSLVFGIPTIKREKTSYLLDTLASLLDGMAQEDKDDCVIVIFIGETNIEFSRAVADDVQKRFPSDINSGLIEIVSPSASFYPDLDAVPLTFGDSRERVKWRTKQNLDFCFLMMYCQKKARFYVQLEDDIVATPSFASTIKTFALQQETNQWLMLEFSALGFIGKLFRSSDLSMVVEFFLMFHKDKPVDWLMDHILWVKVCNPEKDAQHCGREKLHLRIRFKPSLFQHVGKESSLKGKKQTLIDKDFRKGPLFQAHLNPKAEAVTTAESYQAYTIDRAYMGQTFFWAYHPHSDDVMRFKFHKEITIEKFRFKSGNLEHPGDIIRNASVEVLPVTALAEAKKMQEPGREASPEAKKNFMKYEFPLSSYRQVGAFTGNGLAEGVVPQDIGKVVEMRIRVLSHSSENWIIISEIHIVTKDS
ncbi:hypothetical protein OS493_032011 [Desmophyllum pertusum]|uniref:Alpha-1,3-mannosyl-glycoprotein 4-beta-N-acetylglucosaminyltransferase A n=1 Tax=Desmophyllum pertusum TaxID=174260 RepID=A0A9W9Z7X1_9CNID|nr:hypothetical protein OS493_032011 [Desmophyllum pertusum]